MTVREAVGFIKDELKEIYSISEVANIADWLIEHLTKIPREDKITIKDELLKPEQVKQLQDQLTRLKTHEPVQYVLNECWFYGLKFYVDSNVLIPRQETEELVDWIIKNQKFPFEKLKFIDIGTGSGCIAISLKRKFRKAEAWACDASEKALQVARKNAELLGADVRFLKLDFLEADEWEQLPQFDLLISNPPYVPQKDKETMQANVLRYEPASALFVPDNDPLIFYRQIATFGKSHMTPGGMIYAEIYENLGNAVVKLFEAAGYQCELKKDMQGKDRMIKAALFSV